MSTWLDVRGTPYPAYVLTDDERRRWDFATLLAIAHSDLGSGRLDPAFVWQTTRSLYRAQEFETGTQAQFEEAFAEAVEWGLVEPRTEDHDREPASEGEPDPPLRGASASVVLGATAHATPDAP